MTSDLANPKWFKLVLSKLPWTSDDKWDEIWPTWMNQNGCKQATFDWWWQETWDLANLNMRSGTWNDSSWFKQATFAWWWQVTCVSETIPQTVCNHALTLAYVYEHAHTPEIKSKKQENYGEINGIKGCTIILIAMCLTVRLTSTRTCTLLLVPVLSSTSSGIIFFHAFPPRALSPPPTFKCKAVWYKIGRGVFQSNGNGSKKRGETNRAAICPTAPPCHLYNIQLALLFVLQGAYI
jgi:hypothetical protein